MNMHGSRNFRQGCPGQSDKKKALTTFFLVLSLFYRSQRNLSFFKVPEGVQHFPGGGGGGGVQIFPPGGGGVQLPIPYRNPYNMILQGGSGPPVPPSGYALGEHA